MIEANKGMGGPGGERLQRAVAERVRLNSTAIAKSLVEKTLTGHIGSFRLLLRLCEAKKLRTRRVTRRKPTMAMILAADEPWQKGMPEDDWEDDRYMNLSGDPDA